jgi:4-diphosphocytidyl-2C-methyl-D-erythritol kinase
LYSESNLKDFKNHQNSFWAIFIKNNKEIEDFYNKINKDYEICLSGSGSAMFIKYNNAQEKEKILKIIPSNWRFFLAKPLQYSPLREFV